MWIMLQQPKGDDYVVATGETHSIKEMLKVAFDHVNLDWKKYVKFDERYLRPSEVDVLLGDASKAKKKLGWVHQTGFKELIKRMVDHDLDLAQQEKKARS
jgi:GDPmannose 4,6-dehydratase